MKVLLVRSYATRVDLSSYNLQEVGLAKALTRRGIKCDIVYFSKSSSFEKETIFEHNGLTLDIYWVKGIRIFKSAIYTKLLTNGLLKGYDIIQADEYHQPMSLIISMLYRNKAAIYHGPYCIRGNKFIYRFYDLLFLHFIRKNVKCIFTKSYLAEEFLKERKLSNVTTVGVGLDTDNINNADTKGIEDNSSDKMILYVGTLDDNKNIRFLLDVFKNVIERLQNVRLTIIGQGDAEVVKEYFEYASSLEVSEHISYKGKVCQRDIGQYYKKADVFVFPSKYDIFGMVLLESMYFGLPVVSSNNGGSNMLIKHGVNGYVLKEYDAQAWARVIIGVLSGEKTDCLKVNAKETIVQNFTWDRIAEKIITEYKARFNLNESKMEAL